MLQDNLVKITIPQKEKSIMQTLIDAGFEGPQIGQALNHLFDAVCEGIIENKRDQLISMVKTLQVIN